MNSKQTLIILPGWGGTKKTWSEFAELASEHFDVKIIELPCFGDEPCPKEVWGIEEYADFVKSEIRNQKSEIILFGHSFGGQVATQLVADNPEICNKLILSGAAVFRKKISLKNIIFKPIAIFGNLFFKLPILNKKQNLARKILYKITKSSDYNKTSGIKREIFKKIIKQDISHLLPKIKIPTLVVWGTKDTYTPLRNGKKITKLISNSNLKIIKGGKHGLHIQQPKNLFKNIQSFIYQ